MKVTIQNLHIHINPAAPVNSMGEALAKALLQDAEQPDPLPEAEQDKKEDDLNAPLTEKDLREVAPFFVAAITQILADRQSKAADTTP